MILRSIAVVVLLAVLSGLAAQDCFDWELGFFLADFEERSAKPQTPAEHAATRSPSVADREERIFDLIREATDQRDPVKLLEAERLAPNDYVLPMRRSAILIARGETAAALEAESAAFLNWNMTSPGNRVAGDYRVRLLNEYAQQLRVERARGAAGQAAVNNLQREYCAAARNIRVTPTNSAYDQAVREANAGC